MRVLFDGSLEEHYLRELEKLCDSSLTPLQKEIKYLEKLGLIRARKNGNRVYYAANTDHPLYPDLVSIVEKTVGVIAQLQMRLKDERISFAFIFGSMAKGEEKAHSDVDLFLIGDITMRAFTKLLSGMQQKIGREVNPHIYSKEEFIKRLQHKDHFILNVMKSKKKKVVGDISDLEKLYKEGKP